jgi:TPP-dependent pyruvate/acetoin dehydrogenase alpha subunit
MTTHRRPLDTDDPQVQHLVDPTRFRGPLCIDGEEADVLLRMLGKMQLIRRAEEHLGDMVESGKVVCPCHLGIGQEAIAVGVAEAIGASGRVFGAHRSHPHYLALNDDVAGLFAEVLGRVGGCSGGMGGSMHLVHRASGFYGSVPIVAGTVPIAAGAGLAAKLAGDGAVAVSYFGDGAIEEGVVQETLNAAAVMKLPVIFICENNLFSSHMHISLRQPDFSTARFADAHRIDSEVVDGNDVSSMKGAAERAVSHTVEGRGPYFIEAFTYRWRGHVGHREDMDVGVKRKDDLQLWKGRDPIRRLRDAMQRRDLLTPEGWVQIMEDTDRTVTQAWEQAEASPYPPQSALLDLVYAHGDKETSAT